MSNSYFQFKQFTIWHDKCAMKVGTDGVLLGAWAPTNNAKNILDIGAGTGLISLMIAQRCLAKITAIEIDKDAANQAAENVKSSLWEDRIDIINTDFKEYKSNIKFDLIVSNPPYFSDSLLSPNTQRSTARHTNELTYNELFKGVSNLLEVGGEFSIIIPSDVSNQIKDIASSNNLFLVRQTHVYPKPNSSPKRDLLSFSTTPIENPLCDNLTIELSRHQYSEEYISLTKSYYLKM